MSDLPPPDTPPPPPSTPGHPNSSATPRPHGRRSRRTPLLVAVGTVAAAAIIIGGIAVGSGGGDDDSAPADSSSGRPQETTSDTSAKPSTDPSSEPTESADTTPATTVMDATTTTTTSEPQPVDDDPRAAAAANVGLLAEQQSPECPLDAAVVETMASELGGQLARRGTDRLDGSTLFRQRTTGAAAIFCSAGNREEGVALYLGPLGEASLRAWTTQALSNDAVRLRELAAQGDATVFAVDSSTELGDLSLAQKGAAWTDGTLVMMLLGVSIGGQRVDVDPGDAGRALVGSADQVVTQLADIELAEPPPAVPIDEPIDTSVAVTNLLAITERGRTGEAMECPVSIDVLDAFNEPVQSTFLNRILDESSIMGAGVYVYQRRGPTALRCTAGVENGLFGIYLGTLRGADPGRWLATIEPTLQYKQVGTEQQGTLLAVRERDPVTSIRGAAWSDGDLIVMIAGVGSPNALDFSPDKAAAGLRPALQAIVAELQDR